jgi:hypothetical protein
MGARWLSAPLFFLAGVGCSERPPSSAGGGPVSDATASDGDSDASTLGMGAPQLDATAIEPPPGCAEPCVFPYDTCASLLSVAPGVLNVPSCCHIVQLLNGTEVYCLPTDGGTLSPLDIFGAPSTPPVYCALDVGPVDAADMPDVGPIQWCTDHFPCTHAGPDASGWLCCQDEESYVGSVRSDQYKCLPPDGGPLPVYFPPPVDSGILLVNVYPPADAAPDSSTH